MVSSYLKKHGYVTEILFLPSSERVYPKRVIEEVIDLVADSDIIGFSCTCYTSYRAEHLIRSLKVLKKIIVWGGAHATFDVTECLRYADFVCMGEGEEAMLELVRRLEKGQDVTKIKNMWVKKSGSIIKNPLREVVTDLDRLPFLDFEVKGKYVLYNGRIIPLEEYYMMRGSPGFVSVQASRGCFHSCAYCFNSFLKRLYKHKGFPVRFRSTKNIVAELSSLKNKMPPLEYMACNDSSFFLRSDKEIETFNRLYKKNIGVPFSCNGDPFTITPNKLKFLVESGLKYIRVGIQTGSEVLNKNVYNRNINNAQVIKVANLINKYKDELSPEYDIIITNPYETEEDIIKTIKLLIRLPKPYNLNRYNLIFFPGSPLYEKAKKDGLLPGESYCFPPHYEDFNGHLKTKNLKNLYLYYLLYFMGQEVTSQRYGLIPKFMLKLLIDKRTIRFCNSSKLMVNIILPSLIKLQSSRKLLTSSRKKIISVFTR